jgi:hypothetical protein
LGYCNDRCTPVGRGFDSYYGGFSGEADYNEHVTIGGYYTIGTSTIRSIGQIVEITLMQVNFPTNIDDRVVNKMVVSIKIRHFFLFWDKLVHKVQQLRIFTNSEWREHHVPVGNNTQETFNLRATNQSVGYTYCPLQDVIYKFKEVMLSLHT